MRKPVAVAAVLALAAVAPAAAHHGWSGYDASRIVTLQGSVQQATFDNPHAQIALQTDAKAWRIVLAPPSRMGRRGLPAGSIAAGDTASVEGYAHRTDPEEFRAERITVGGKTVELR